PKGFAPINEGEALWGEENATNKGLVIVDKSGTDTDGNEFVWIPVPNFSEFVRTDDYYNGLGPTISACLESKPSDSDATEEVKAMYKSVETNKGFYIARYEAGKINGTATDGTVKPVSKKGVAVWNYISWGTNNSDTDPGNGAVTVARAAYPKADKNLAVASTLMYGVQCDAILRFIETSEGKTMAQIKDSSSWGNYSDNVNRENIKPNDPAISGGSNTWEVNNIYDLAGNLWEWTMESCSSDRVFRCGSYLDLGSKYCVSYRLNYPIYSNQINIGFRQALYLKQ
ncbi:MAG: hypothetical protein RSE00_04695, partial [Clostridia bacterium]